MKGLAFLLCFNILAGSLLPKWELHELSDIMELVEHFHDHSASTLDESGVIDFLYMHYADGKHQDAPEHENLPFHHSHEHQFSGLFFDFAPVTTFPAIDYFAQDKSIPLFDSNLFSSYSHSIWQPPKI